MSINTTWNIVNFRAGLIRRLKAEGFRIVAVSPFDEHVPTLGTMGVEHIAVAIDNKGVSPLRDLGLLREYWQILRVLQPIAFLGWTIKPNVWGSLAAHALGIPVINNISGLGTAFIKSGLLTQVVRLLYRIALARSAIIFFQNQHDRNLFIAQRLVSGSRSALLPGSGIDLTEFAPAKIARTDSPFVFLMVARLLRDKGVVEFAEAARYVRRSRPDVRFQLLGFLDVANRTAINRSTVDEWVDEGILDYLGEARDVRPYLAASSAVVLPSYREGMPRSLLEAAAMGKPLIATDVPGCTDIARSGENAILCPPRSAEALADAMLAMLALDTADLLAFGRRSRDIAEAEFDTAVVEQRYVTAIETIMSKMPSIAS